MAAVDSFPDLGAGFGDPAEAESPTESPTEGTAPLGEPTITESPEAVVENNSSGKNKTSISHRDRLPLRPPEHQKWWMKLLRLRHSAEGPSVENAEKSSSSPPEPDINELSPTPSTSDRLGLVSHAATAWHNTVYAFDWLIHPRLRKQARLARDKLWERRKVQFTLTVANSKGGSGKTPVSVWLSVFYALATKCQVAAVDVNENSGHTADNLGIEPESTIHFRDFLDKVRDGEISNHADVSRVADRHPEASVWAIGSDPKENKRISRWLVKAGLDVLKSCVHAVVCDCGNGITSNSNLEAVIKADVLIFPSTLDEDSLKDIDFTMKRYTELNLGDKVERGIIVILGANRKRHQEFANRYNWPFERIVTVPFNSYMAGHNPVRYRRVSLKVRVALLEILVAVVDAAASWNNNKETS